MAIVLCVATPAFRTIWPVRYPETLFGQQVKSNLVSEILVIPFTFKPCSFVTIPSVACNEWQKDIEESVVLFRIAIGWLGNSVAFKKIYKNSHDLTSFIQPHRGSVKMDVSVWVCPN
jgi:hypothetical protein